MLYSVSSCWNSQPLLQPACRHYVDSRKPNELFVAVLRLYTSEARIATGRSERLRRAASRSAPSRGVVVLWQN